ncbi:MAG: hypothetical protein JW909_13160 [Planctomycetes bacterium]|nr:hypothetical protein [Planctomycetota bacterium]
MTGAQTRRTWIDPPLQADRAVYDEALSVYAERCLSDPGFVSLYQMGEVSDPGISDVDLVLVLDPARLRHGPFYFSSRRLPRELSRLFMHEALVLDMQAFSSVEQLHPVSNLKLLAGMELERAGAATDVFKALLMANLAVSFLSIEFNALRNCRTLSERYVLAKLKKLLQSLRLLESLLRKNLHTENTSRYGDSVVALRTRWFDLPLPERRAALVNLVDQADGIASSLIPPLNDFLVEKYLDGHGHGLSGTVCTYRFFDRALSIGSGGSVPRPSLGSFWAWHLRAYASCAGTLGRHVARNLCCRNVPEEYSVDQRYLQAVRTHAAWLERLALLHGGMRFWYGGVYAFGMKPPFFTRLLGLLQKYV